MVPHFIVTPEFRCEVALKINNCLGAIMMIDEKELAKRMVKATPLSEDPILSEPLPVMALNCRRVVNGSEEIHLLIHPRCFDA